MRKRFQHYYSTQHLSLPLRFGRREWAFVFWEKDYMVRHTAFRRANELNTYVTGAAPRHVYYSSAYYRDPANRSMKEKEWLGADLIFDLDADHLKEAVHLTFPEMLKKVKKEYIKLLDFITEDFGFGEDQLEMVFSGGRGYHLHVHSTQVFELGSEGRREIVDYITGKGLDTSSFLREVPYKKIDRGKYPADIKSMKVLEREYGWKRRIYNGILDFVGKLESIPEHRERVNYLTKKRGIGKKSAETILKRLFSGAKGSRGADLLREGKVDFFGDKRTAEKFFSLAFEHAVAISKAETDEPVTGDVHRLIRTPGSLHGKSGLRVTHLASREELDDFDPFSDTVVFPEEPVEVVALRKLTFGLKGEAFSLNEDESLELPEYAAVFALGMGFAEIGGKKGTK